MNKKWMLPVATLLLMAAAAPGNAASFSKQVPVGPQDRVVVSNVAGSVTITAWDRPEVDVQGELGVDVESVEVRQEQGGVEIRVITKDGSWFKVNSWQDSQARLQIRVPPGVRLEASTVSASLSVNGVRGARRLRSVSGDVRSDVIGADLEAKSVSGNIDLSGSGAPVRVRATSVSGDVTMNRLAGDVEARSTSGDVDVALEGATDVRLHAVSGDVAARGTLAHAGNLEAESVSGRVKMAAQAAGGFRYDVTSYSGDVRNCFGATVEPRNGNGSGGRVEGVRDEGAGNVHLKSHSGRVEICDR